MVSWGWIIAVAWSLSGRRWAANGGIVLERRRDREGILRWRGKMRHPYLLIYSEQRREKITTTHHSRPHSCPCSANLHPLWELSFPLIANAVFPPPLSILSAILPLTYEFISAIVSQYDIGTAAAIASSVEGKLDLDHPPVRRVIAMAAHWDNLWH